MGFIASSFPPVEIGEYSKWDVELVGDSDGQIEVRRDLNKGYLVKVSVGDKQDKFDVPYEMEDSDVTSLAEERLLGLVRS